MLDVTSADGFKVEIPCENMKVADSLICEDYFVYCTSPDDLITMQIQGSGDVFVIN